MKIESRFNLKEEVFYFNTKIYAIESGIIKQVNFCENVSGARTFTFCVGEKYYNIDESRCFKTKRELISFLENSVSETDR